MAFFRRRKPPALVEATIEIGGGKPDLTMSRPPSHEELMALFLCYAAKVRWLSLSEEESIQIDFMRGMVRMLSDWPEVPSADTSGSRRSRFVARLYRDDSTGWYVTNDLPLLFPRHHLLAHFLYLARSVAFSLSTDENARLSVYLLALRMRLFGEEGFDPSESSLVKAVGLVNTLLKGGLTRRARTPGMEAVALAYERGREELGQRNIPEALKHFDRAIKLHPESRDSSLAEDPRLHEVRFARAQAHLTAGDYQEALEELNAVAQERSGDMEFHFARGFATFRLERYADAVREMSRVLEIQSHGSRRIQALRDRAYAQMKLERYEGAVADASQVLKTDSKDALMLFVRGASSYCLDRLDVAHADVEAGLQIEPEGKRFLALREDVRRARRETPAPPEVFSFSAEVVGRLADPRVCLRCVWLQMRAPTPTYRFKEWWERTTDWLDLLRGTYPDVHGVAEDWSEDVRYQSRIGGHTIGGGPNLALALHSGGKGFVAFAKGSGVYAQEGRLQVLAECASVDLLILVVGSPRGVLLKEVLPDRAKVEAWVDRAAKVRQGFLPEPADGCEECRRWNRVT